MDSLLKMQKTCTLNVSLHRVISEMEHLFFGGDFSQASPKPENRFKVMELSGQADSEFSLNERPVTLTKGNSFG